MSATLQHTWKTSPDAWVLSLKALTGQNRLVAASSDGSILLYSLDRQTSIADSKIAAHGSSVRGLAAIDAHTVASCAQDGVKVWDVRSASAGRPVVLLAGLTSLNFLLVAASGGHFLAAGTELAGADAELAVWDWRNPGNAVRNFVDSHHDDVSAVEFHPTMAHYVMSGATDGAVHIYDTREADEDDLLHQVVSYSLVHSCHFTRERRISVLSHMETLAFYELNNTDYESPDEPAPNDWGDVRSMWSDCDYVVDVYASGGYVAYGANLRLKLALCPFDLEAEKVDVGRPIWFPGAHGEEVVRDVVVVGGSLALTGGEDGIIRSWKLPYAMQGLKWAENIGEEGNGVENEKDHEMDSAVGSRDQEMESVPESVPEKGSGDRKKHHKKRDKGHKKDKRGKEPRFRPY